MSITGLGDSGMQSISPEMLQQMHEMRQNRQSPEDFAEALVGDKDSDGDSLLSAFTLEDNLVLSPGSDYWLVLSTFSPGATGDFTINTSDNVELCGSVANESRSWTELKGLYR